MTISAVSANVTRIFSTLFFANKNNRDIKGLVRNFISVDPNKSGYSADQDKDPKWMRLSETCPKHTQPNLT